MRIGFWNRLAIVAAGVFTLALPTYLHVDYVQDADNRRTVSRDLCIKWAEAKETAHLATRDECWQDYFNTQIYPSSEFWWQGAGAALLISAILYTLILIVVLVSKWVWRGRAPTA